jgi:Transposase DDE domain
VARGVAAGRSRTPNGLRHGAGDGRYVRREQHFRSRVGQGFGVASPAWFAGAGRFGVRHLWRGSQRRPGRLPDPVSDDSITFQTVRRQATLIEDFHGHRTYEASWTPSVKDRKSHPELPGDAALDVFLHEVPLENGETLLLVTTLPTSNAQAGEYYARRYDVEHDIRDIKVTLDTENIRAQSVDMVQKELLTSMVAYNLVVQFRRQAAKLANLPPRRLSFTNVLHTFGSFLLKQAPGDAETWIERFEQALRLSAKHDKLPNRSQRRNPPRRAHPRRPKFTKFMKSQNSAKPEKPPLEKPK